LTLLVSGVGWEAWNQTQSSSLGPATHGHGGAPGVAPSGLSNDPCALPVVTCSASRTHMTFKMAVPMSWTRPDNFTSDVMNIRSNQLGSTVVSIDARRKDVSGGVDLAMPVRAAGANGPLGPKQGGPTNARAFAQWIAARPFVDASPVTRGTLGGRQAWAVQVTVKPGIRGDGCNPNANWIDLLWGVGDNSYPAQFIWKCMTARYTFVDIPGAGTASVWDWTFDDPSTLAGNQPLIDSITFAAR